ncbi:MAG: asparagine synthase (glutamine-hydrolyzing) [Candidatus Hodarchaeota archaeon]
MCGLLFSKGKIDRKLFEDSLSLMRHRGPDFSSTLFIDDISMGHNRLSIIDLNPRSHQPFRYKNYIIIFNGEIYNYKELITDHKLMPKTTSDTEVILLMYEKYGYKCLDYFNGMFAFVIYNSERKEIFAARDRLGIKPLYMRTCCENTFFSSEIAPLLKIKSSDLDDFAFRQYRKLRMTIKGYTFYKDIKMFPPGHYYLNGKLSRYWELDTTSKQSPSDEELEWLIMDSVKLRKRSDVPLGSYLSGGLDSTILSALLKPTHTWTVGFESLNEFMWSELANSKLDTKHHKIVVDKYEYLKTTENMIRRRMEPLSVPNEVLIYIMTKEVKKYNTVILSGEGADELFWGYDRIFKWAYKAKELNINEFDAKYCYGTNNDVEILAFALEDLPGKNVIDKIAYYFQIIHLQGLLRRLDNSTMLCSVEARVPFVDHRLVELLAGTSYEYRMGKSIKEPLKRIYRNLIPEEIINREKVGFPVPLNEIFSSKNNTTPMDNWLLFNINTITN